MKADHLLHANIDRGWLGLSFECIGDPAEHYTLWERTCDCDCEMCSGDDPDHWGCLKYEDDMDTFNGLPACQVERDNERCWVHEQDCPIEETFTGEWPKGLTWPVPVHVEYNGDGEWETRYAGGTS